jgi:hypothetical protein
MLLYPPFLTIEAVSRWFPASPTNAPSWCPYGNFLGIFWSQKKFDVADQRDWNKET